MDSLKKILVGIIAALSAIVYFLVKKNQKAEGLLQNQETKEQLTKIDGQIEQVKGTMTAEEEKRKNITENMNKEVNKNVSENEMLEFLNRKPPNSK